MSGHLVKESLMRSILTYAFIMPFLTWGTTDKMTWQSSLCLWYVGMAQGVETFLFTKQMVKCQSKKNKKKLYIQEMAVVQQVN